MEPQNFTCPVCKWTFLLVREDAVCPRCHTNVKASPADFDGAMTSDFVAPIRKAPRSRPPVKRKR